MSTASVKLPNWINYGLMPLINLIVAFLISGLVVWFIGESPLEAVKLLLQGALGDGEGFMLIVGDENGCHAGLFQDGAHLK